MTREAMAIELIQKCEGFKSHAYQDSAGVWSIGFGSTRDLNGIKIQSNDICLLYQAEQLLKNYLERNVYVSVKRMFIGTVEPIDEVFAALCSLAYNVGAKITDDEDIKNALHNNDLYALADAFRKYIYVHVNGVATVCEGLVNRREIEINYFLGSVVA